MFVLPRSQQVEAWRKWAADDRVSELRAEALRQLTWANDKTALEHNIDALDSSDPAVRTTAAAALAMAGSDSVARARVALRDALAAASKKQRPAMVWALVELSDKRIAEQALEYHRKGAFDTVTALDGTPAFRIEKLARLLDLTWLFALSNAPEPGLRQVSAFGLSRNAAPAHAEVLSRLVSDEDTQVASEAAPGLAKIGNPAALAALHDALNKADKDRYQKMLEALRDRSGVAGLAAALPASTPASEATAIGQYRLQVIFDMMFSSESVGWRYDGRVGQLLLAWIKTPRHPHWQTRVALTLGQMGDPRAVPLLARRLRQDPLRLYRCSSDNDFELRLCRDDNERVVAARLIADLAEIYPREAENMRVEAEDALMSWMHGQPSPHTNAMRALAKLGSKKDIKSLRAWANPTAKLPQEGDQPPMPEEWVIALGAQRYVGRLRDEPSFPGLLAALKRRPANIDISMDNLMQGGLAILGMSLLALAEGAANGLSEWGDNRAFLPLLMHAESPLENERSRTAACVALPWVANQADRSKIIDDIRTHSSADKRDEFLRNCLLEGLINRPQPGTANELFALFATEVNSVIRHQIARAIGKAGITREIEADLFAALQKPETSVDAALALMLGASPQAAARAVATVARSGSSLDELSELWYRSFGYWTEEDIHFGRIFRWIDNAKAIGRVAAREGRYDFANLQLKKQFDDLYFDNGPHSLTRNVLRMRLLELRGVLHLREPSREALEYMKMNGALLQLEQ
jgi:HEAT repeat protein